MNPLPLPIRLAAGVVVIAVERARDLPSKLIGLPVTLVSQALQASMRMRQRVTEVAIRGDNVLSAWRPVEQTPQWATFDEDGAITSTAADFLARNGKPAWDRAETAAPGEDGTAAEPVGNGTEPDDVTGGDTDPWAAEERALAEDLAATSAVRDQQRFDSDRPTAFPGYPELSLPQLRARLRQFTVDQLIELLTYERAHADRAEFTGMLSRRIDT
ncbi:MAG: lipid droplet-associated protein, partial [Sciscionella sp.]|nr:lipid droplet-associated protein [Sciscionella sp.]